MLIISTTEKIKMIYNLNDPVNSAGLNKDQLKFLDLVNSKNNTLLSGCGGVGKTYVTKHLVDLLVNCEYPFCILASTGVAAALIGGSTFHSWCFGGLGDDSVEDIVSKIRKRRNKSSVIRKSKLLIVDEAWMLSSSVIEKADAVLRKIRGSKLPFGGLQVVFSGDPLQLPPVNKGVDKNNFLFDAECFESFDFKYSILNKIVRQEGDLEYSKFLMEIREGVLDNVSILKDRTFSRMPKMMRVPPVIYSKNIDVEIENKNRLRDIEEREHVFVADDTGSETLLKHLDKNCTAPKTLVLKKGCQVMLLRNLDTAKGVVNGSIGIVQSLSPEGIIVKFKQGDFLITKETWEIKESTIIGDKPVLKTVASRTQFPLKLAYAFTIHKMQGQTIEMGVIDLNGCFEYGQAYTALSRIKSRDGLFLKPFNTSVIKAHPRALDFYRKIAYNNA